MTNARTDKIRVGDWEVSPATCTLVGNEGHEVKVTPRSMDVLIYLADNAGVVISPDELLGHFWHGTMPSDHAVHKAIAELRSALGDDAHNPQYIKTFPKRGYVLIADVDISARGPAETENTIRHIASDKKRLAFRWTRDLRPVYALVVLVLVSLAYTLTREIPAVESEDSIRLAVLPFTNRELNTDNQFLADGLRESLIHGLSKLSHLEVLSPGDTTVITGSRRNNKEFNVNTSADHILQGSVQTAEGRLRVTVQLVRTNDGILQYSDRFDMPLDNLFGVQDEIVSNVVRALSIHLDEQERAQMLDWGTSNALAYENFLRGEFYNNQFNPRDWHRAIDYHMAAVELDPDFLNAWHGAATAANNLAVYSTPKKIRALSKHIDYIHDQVAQLAPDDSDVLSSLREIRLRVSGNNQLQQEIHLREQILSGSPPDFAIAHYALFLVGARLYDEAQQFLELASEVGPFEISPDEVWSYRSSVEPPKQMVVSGKIQLLQRPYHIAFLGTVATNLALTGDFEEAERYLARQQAVDEEGILSHLTEVIIRILSNNLDGKPEDLLRPGQNYVFNNGVISFMTGNIEAGIAYWSQQEPLQMRRLFNLAHAVEKFFPDKVIDDPRYHALLDELGAGISWQRTLMEGIMAMEPVTGVSLGAKARAAYDDNTFMSRNNLWTEETWAMLQSHKPAIN
ncbi:MAG: winged helix-turn-helix domain-containing protein [Pseudomonadales bacterium]|nr:winged helix-turn-helix domain-containing protein [Pseudomonadales bacterium]